MNKFPIGALIVIIAFILMIPAIPFIAHSKIMNRITHNGNDIISTGMFGIGFTPEQSQKIDELYNTTKEINGKVKQIKNSQDKSIKMLRNLSNNAKKPVSIAYRVEPSCKNAYMLMKKIDLCLNSKEEPTFDLLGSGCAATICESSYKVDTRCLNTKGNNGIKLIRKECDKMIDDLEK
ncbi:MAG TPA: hypothetical protein P5096_03120 [Patescibacteria group bacterium]|nr:hypothetical protein [Patescibacteria group bacterium]